MARYCFSIFTLCKNIDISLKSSISLSPFIRWIRCSCWYTEWSTSRVRWLRCSRDIVDVECTSSGANMVSFVRARYDVFLLAFQPTTKAVVVAATRRDGKERKKGEAVGWIHRRRKKGHHNERECDRRTWEMSAGKLEEGKKERDGMGEERRMGWDRTDDFSTAAPTSNKHARTSNFEY